MIIFQNIFALKELLACMTVFSHIPKLKTGLELAFGAYFQYDFSIAIKDTMKTYFC